MKLRDKITVVLPGEAIWVVVLAILDDDRIIARIDNTPVSDLHHYKRNQILTFQKRRQVWVISNRQERMGPRLVAA